MHEVLTDKQATKLMAECGNVFENFIQTFYVKFNRLQISGFHGKINTIPRSNRTVSPNRARMSNARTQLIGDAYADASGSKVVREHAYGAGPNRQSPGLQRDASSAMSTENYHSNAALPPVKEYATEGKNKNIDSIA